MYFRTQMRLDIVPEDITTQVGTYSASGAVNASLLSVVVSTYFKREIGQTINEGRAPADTDLHIGHRFRHL